MFTKTDDLVKTVADREVQLLQEFAVRREAWDAVHALPPVPEAPLLTSTSSVAEYMRKRLQQLAPVMLERRIRTAILDPGAKGDEAAREVLNRAGFTERPEGRVEFNGPVLIANMQPGQLPWHTKKGDEHGLQDPAGGDRSLPEAPTLERAGAPAAEDAEPRARRADHSRSHTDRSR